MMGVLFRLILLLIATAVTALGSPFQTESPSVKCKLEALDEPATRAIGVQYIAICSALDLRSVPDDLPSSTVELYLDQNRIPVVAPFAFSYMPRLRVVDLSFSNVTALRPNCFAGLHYLEELYLPFNNIVSASQVPPGVFDSLSQLRIIHVQGYYNGNYSTWVKEIKTLDSLEELAISYLDDMVFPSELANLPNLTNLQLSFGLSTRINPQSLNTLRRGKIQELSFKVNENLTFIEPGSFDDMPELRLLNFACCYNLGLDNIIDALSNVSNTQVTHLIVDNVNDGLHGDDIYGEPDVLECRSLWHHLTHLSLQAWGVLRFHAAALKCFQNLTAVSYGYAEGPLPYEGLKVLRELAKKVLPKSAFQSMRLSYMLKNAYDQYRNQWGCYPPYERRPNMDYFPPMKELTPESTMSHHHSDAAQDFETGDSTDKEIENNVKQSNGTSFSCQDVSFIPRNLQHLAVDNIGFSLKPSYFCLRFGPNNLRFVNLSNSDVGSEMNGVTYGLDQLRILDLSRSGYTKLSSNLLEHLPSLTHFYASGNSLRQDSFTSIAKVRKLQHLDLSDNAIPEVNRGAFLGLSELRMINLANNRLNSTDFLVDIIPFVRSIDISSNQVRSLNQRLRDAIDARCAKADFGLELSLLDNPLSCGCQDLPFIKWMKTTRANLTKAEMVKCTGQDGQLQTVNSIDVSSMERHCNIRAHLPLIASISATVAMVVLVAAPLAYRFRWHLRWYLYRMQYLRRRQRYAARPEPRLRDAFVIYAFENTEDRLWVFNTLRPRLEQNNYNLWLEGRNDIPGRFRVDNLLDMLARSCTAIWILSQAFLRDTMCLEMAHQAFIRLGHRRNIVVRRPEAADGIDEELARQNIERILEVLHPRYGIRVAEYTPENRHSETLFWEQIGGFLNQNGPNAHEEENVPLDHDAPETQGLLFE